MDQREIFAQINFIGLGGTGCNILTRILSNQDFLDFYIHRQELRLNMLAVDVADGDVNELKQTYDALVARLSELGVPRDKLFLRAVTIKFNSPDVLFDFLQNYPKYLKTSEGKDIANYHPWIDSKMRIPNLAGGVGRMRALAKAVYALNYYHFTQLSNVLEEFLNRVSTSSVQPIIMMLFGAGGGTGSGIAYDMAKHVRKKVGGGIPIMGLVVLPSNADDSLAKGPSAYMMMEEYKSIFDLAKEQDNPFTAMFFLPLQVAVTETKGGTLNSAKLQIDEEILNVIKIMASFDMADMLADIGANRNLGDKYMNVLGFLKVRYPIEDYIRASKIYMDELQLLGDMIREKSSLLRSAEAYLDYLRGTGLDALAHHLASIGESPKDADRKAEEIVKMNSKHEVEVSQVMKMLADYLSDDFIDRYAQLLKSMRSPEDSVEGLTLSRIVGSLEYLKDNLASPDFDLGAFGGMVEDAKAAIRRARFTARQVELLEQITSFMDYSILLVRVFQKFYFTRYLLEDISKRISTQDAGRASEFRRIVDEDLSSLIKYLNTVISKPRDERSSLPQYAGSFQAVKGRIAERVNGLKMEIDQIEARIARFNAELVEVTKDLKRTNIFSGGKRKRLEREMSRLNQEITRSQAELEAKRSELDSWQKMLGSVDSMLKYADVTGNYWKTLNRYVRLDQEYNEVLSNAVRSDHFFESVLDLSEEERLKIIALMLSGIEEDQLRKPETLNEIVDIPRFKGNLKGKMRIFSSPSFFGLNGDYRTDSIWAIVSAPRIWDSELEEELKNQLAQYLSVSANLGVSVRPINPVEPWTVEFLVVMSKARPEDLEIHNVIKQNALSYPPEELLQFRSYKVEEG
jgi:hypothetical protein